MNIIATSNPAPDPSHKWWGESETMHIVAMDSPGGPLLGGTTISLIIVVDPALTSPVQVCMHMAPITLCFQNLTLSSLK